MMNFNTKCNDINTYMVQSYPLNHIFLALFAFYFVLKKISFEGSVLMLYLKKDCI